MLDLDIEKILDEEENVIGFNLREIISKIQDNINENIITSFKGKHITISPESGSTNFIYKHNLGFKPEDIQITSVIPSSVNVRVLYEKSNNESISLNISDKCDIRLLVGKYR